MVRVMIRVRVMVMVRVMVRVRGRHQDRNSVPNALIQLPLVGVANGWRPLAGNIIEKTIEKFTAPNQQISAWLGPAIGPTAFEVGSDVVNAFTCMNSSHIDDFTERQNKKFLADIFSIAKRQLSSLGITQIYSHYECTFSMPTKYFSYRRDAITGRLATLIWRK